MTSLRIVKAWNIQPELQPIAEYQSAKLPSAGRHDTIQLRASHLLATQTHILKIRRNLFSLGIRGSDSRKSRSPDSNI